MWQHMQGMVGFLMNHFTANLPRNPPVKKNLTIGKDLTDCGREFVVSLFWPTLYTTT